MSDVDFGDLLDYLAHEIDVRAIILYMEGITEARKFMSAARAASRLMPVIVIRCRSLQSLNDITLKPSQLTDDDLVFDAAFRRAGMLRVQEIGDLFGAVETLGTGRMANGDQLAILTNGGGVGALAADALIGHGGRLAKLSSNTHSALRNLLPKTSSVANPIDMTADVPASHYGKVLKLLLADRGVEAMLLLHAPTGIISPLDAARAVVSALGKSKACVLTCWLGETVPREARQLFAEYRVPTYDTPERAVRAFMHIITYRRNQEMLMQTPASVPEVFKPDQGTSRRIIAEALEEGRRVLTDIEARSILEAYEIPVVRSVTVHDEYEAKQAAEQIGGKVTVEIKLHGNCSLDGMETLAADLDTPQQVADAVDRMRRAASKVYPGTQLEGVVVQESVDRPTAYELFVGIGDHPEFGPVILFGAGGPAWDIIDDIVVALPPLNMHLALDAIQRTRISWQLRGFRGRAPVALDDLALTLVKISQLVVDFAEVTSLTINPLVVDQQGVIATMPTVGIARASVAPAKRLAIRPYPKELEELLSLPNGQAFLLRPVLPEDEPEFQSLFERLTPEDVRMRFFAPKKELMHPVAARMTQIDYDREMALVLATPGPAGRSPIFGAVHISADPDNETAEYAIMLQSDMSGMGLGPMLMRKIIDYSRKRGIKEIYGEVLRENRPMLKVCDLFHFSRSVRPDDPGTVEVRLKL